MKIIPDHLKIVNSDGTTRSLESDPAPAPAQDTESENLHEPKQDHSNKNYGHVNEHRSVLDSPIWTDATLYKLSRLCVMLAQWKETVVEWNGSSITLQRGQFITGRYSLWEDYHQWHLRKKKPRCKPSPGDRTLWRALLTLEKLQFLSKCSKTRYSIITVLNYDKEQGSMPKVSKCVSKCLSTYKKRDKEKRKEMVVQNPDVVRLADLFGELIYNHHHHFSLSVLKEKTPEWCKHIDLAIKDGQTVDDLEKVIRWIPTNSYSMKHNQSTKKIRQNFTVLYNRMLSDSDDQDGLATFSKKHAKKDWKDGFRDESEEVLVPYPVVTKAEEQAAKGKYETAETGEVCEDDCSVRESASTDEAWPDINLWCTPGPDEYLLEKEEQPMTPELKKHTEERKNNADVKQLKINALDPSDPDWLKKVKEINYPSGRQRPEEQGARRK